MKKYILFFLISCCPAIAFCQTYVNPDTTQQPGDIYIQNTDVYYCPFAPPDSTDVRGYLSNESDRLRDPNGVGSQWRDYLPVTHGLDTLRNWCPCYDTMRGSAYPYRTPLSEHTVWQRFFTARDKPDQSLANRHSDIIVGDSVTTDTADSRGYGPVTISKNEHVDFRASGTIKMEAGFHVMPGAFFHAYIEPRWGDSVFSDEFDSTAKFQNQWHAVKGHGDVYELMAECSYDSDVSIGPDTGANGAHDGHALDIVLREHLVGGLIDTCTCNENFYPIDDSCQGIIYSGHFAKFLFSTAIMRSCPFPWISDVDTMRPAYQQMPDGKWEIREKMPITPHHANNWLAGLFEIDMNEIVNGYMPNIKPDIGLDYKYGPFKGMFHTSGSTTYFVSSEPQWSLTNNPNHIYINGFPYEVNLAPGHLKDSVVDRDWTVHMGGFPPSLADSTGSVSFYYGRTPWNTTDSMTWTVSRDTGGYRIFSASYRDSSGTLLRFSKAYQPTSVVIITSNIPFKRDTIGCHWDYSLNYPTDSGLLLLDNPLDSSTDLLSNTETISYYINEAGDYPIAPVQFDTSQYKYHTFAIELLPHELRFLVDSNVVRRLPDRLIPPGDRRYDVASNFERSPEWLLVGETDIDNSYDPFGTDTSHDVNGNFNSVTHAERVYFESHDTSLSHGFWPVTIGGNTYPAAHDRIDYVKIWQLPSDMKVPEFPH